MMKFLAFGAAGLAVLFLGLWTVGVVVGLAAHVFVPVALAGGGYVVGQIRGRNAIRERAIQHGVPRTLVK